MAQYVLNKGGFMVLLLNRKECKDLGFGIGGGICICDSCSKEVRDNDYYIAVLNSVYCKECAKRFCTYVHHTEDLKYEARAMGDILRKLEEKGTSVTEFVELD